MPRVLHVLSQRPLRTGSGVTLDATVRLAADAGWEQAVVVGTPADEPRPGVGGLSASRVHPLVFDRAGGVLDYPVPGMSDVMPYPSSRFSALSAGQLASYRAAWSDHLRRVVDAFEPDVIHAHHVWLLSSLLKDLFPSLPVVTQSHATGFRQMELCPHLAAEVRQGCRRHDAFLVLHRGHARLVADRLGVPADSVHVVGAGYREDLFHGGGRQHEPDTLLYAGKYSRAKGLPWLLDAVEALTAEGRDVTLTVAGEGAGPEADRLRTRMERMPQATLLGQVAQGDLADAMGRAAVFVLPSLYEGLPLVLVEARARGCRLVATALEAVEHDLAPALGEALEAVPPPRVRIDEPFAEDLPAFVHRLTDALRRSLDRPPLPAADDATLREFRWSAVFRRIERVWRAAS